MKKLPVSEAAQVLGISKEAVYNRIRRGSLEVVEKNGQKFVVLDNDSETTTKQTQKSKKQTQSEQKHDKFIDFLLSELTELKEQNQNLQSDKERLFKEKEQMLADSKTEIIAIYKDRDEKLMQFLNAMQKPFLSHTTGENEPVIDAEIDDKIEKKYINLSEYLRDLNLEKDRLKKLQKKMIKRINKSKFIKFKDGVILVKKDKNIKQILGEI